MTQLILMRHGQSEWNRKNLFTGWVDIPLSEQGIAESIEGGKLIADEPIDVIFVSELIRSQMTATLAMLRHKSGKVPCMQHLKGGEHSGWTEIHSAAAQESVIPMFAAWELNERMYGDLQGMNKQQMREQFGDEQVQQWRRSFRLAPPNGESLAMTAERSVEYFQHAVMPWIHKGKNVFIAAHGNSLRAIIMFLKKLTEEEVMHLELKTGEPLRYQWDGARWS